MRPPSSRAFNPAGDDERQADDLARRWLPPCRATSAAAEPTPDEVDYARAAAGGTARAGVVVAGGVAATVEEVRTSARSRSPRP